jgi:hypothetical protein
MAHHANACLMELVVHQTFSKSVLPVIEIVSCDCFFLTEHLLSDQGIRLQEIFVPRRNRSGFDVTNLVLLAFSEVRVFSMIGQHLRESFSVHLSSMFFKFLVNNNVWHLLQGNKEEEFSETNGFITISICALQQLNDSVSVCVEITLDLII